MCYPVKNWKQHGKVFSKWPLVDTIALWARSVLPSVNWVTLLSKAIHGKSH